MKKVLALVCGAAVLCTMIFAVSGKENTNMVSIREADIFDALNILKAITNMTEPLPLKPYDINKNGDIEIFDALEILKGMVGLTNPIMMSLSEQERLLGITEPSDDTTESPADTTEPPTDTTESTADTTESSVDTTSPVITPGRPVIDLNNGSDSFELNGIFGDFEYTSFDENYKAYRTHTANIVMCMRATHPYPQFVRVSILDDSNNGLIDSQTFFLNMNSDTVATFSNLSSEKTYYFKWENVGQTSLDVTGTISS